VSLAYCITTPTLTLYSCVDNQSAVDSDLATVLSKAVKEVDIAPVGRFQAKEKTYILHVLVYFHDLDQTIDL
jgi:thermostable 8-oxoguanine DNA glycosylase